jgi:hypothetical protein
MTAIICLTGRQASSSQYLVAKLHQRHAIKRLVDLVSDATDAATVADAGGRRGGTAAVFATVAVTVSMLLIAT